MLFADGIGAFGLSFRDDQLQAKTSWDSSSLIDASELPVVVEIQLAMTEPGQEPPLEELTLQHRWVRLPVPPLDLEAMFAASRGRRGEGSRQDRLRLHRLRRAQATRRRWPG